MWQSVPMRFVNTKNNPIIPIILVSGQLISVFQEKANLSDNNFTSQFTPVKYTRTLPNFKCKTDKLLPSLEINEDIYF